MTRVKGFTLVELMVIVAILAIVALVAVPSYSSLIRNNQLQAKADELHDFLQYARAEAASRRQPVTLDVSAGEWLLKAGNLERTFTSSSPNASVRTSLSGTATLFRANGTSPSARFTICKDNDPGTGFLIEVMASGVTQLYPRGKQNKSGTALTNCTP